MDNDHDCSSRLFALLEHSDQDGFSWRTCQRSLVGEWEQFSGSWPKQGMMLSGKCYRLPMSEHRTCEEGSLSKAIWPTPTANEDAAGRPGAKMRLMLGNHPAIRNDENGNLLDGTLNPEWVVWLQGFPTGWLS